MSNEEKNGPGSGLVSVEHASFSSGDEQIDLEFTVHNVADRPIYVGCGFRQIQYDADDRTLRFWMSDHGPRPEVGAGRCRFVSTPQTAILEPGEAHTIKQSIPTQITRIFDGGDGTPDFELIDLTETERVTVHTFVAERPFYLQGENGDVRDQTSRWGDPLSVELRRRSPADS